MRALALTVAASAALVSACGGSSGEPRTAPPVSTSPAAASSPAPSGIDAATPEGASEFVRFFYAEISRAFQARDPEIVRRLVLPTCKTCKLYIDSITGIRDENQRFVGGGFAIKFAVAPADAGSTGTARVDVGFDYAGGQFVDAAGKVLLSEPAEKNVEEQVALSRVDGRWKVATVKTVTKK
ncbi:MAG: hypothetical protein QOJ79_383 [Actinomycetota bacterium]|jgi:hypothetical protein|nr:hypothetical protein [Actinomycetota bacterium]